MAPFQLGQKLVEFIDGGFRLRANARSRDSGKGKHVATLMRTLGIEALYRKRNTSKRHPAHKVYPYVLRNMTIDRPNQVWAMDMTYIPMAHGFVYLTAVLY